MHADIDAGTVRGQRLVISLTGEAADAVREMAARQNASPGEIVRRAVAVQRFIDEEVARGATFMIKGSSGEIDRLQFVFT